MSARRVAMIAAAAGLGAALVGGVAFSLDQRSSRGPQLVFDASVAEDFRMVASETWEAFRETFRERLACIPDVTLDASENLIDAAGYHPASATIVVQVPMTAERLGAGLVHELAHHVEFQCPDHAILRPAFLAAQGHPPGTPWFGPADWEAIPSEQYAEATVELVMGARRGPGLTMQLSPAALAVLEEWLGGAQRPTVEDAP